jgi:hypothetical protein
MRAFLVRENIKFENPDRIFEKRQGSISLAFLPAEALALLLIFFVAQIVDSCRCFGSFWQASPQCWSPVVFIGM